MSQPLASMLHFGAQRGAREGPVSSIKSEFDFDFENRISKLEREIRAKTEELENLKSRNLAFSNSEFLAEVNEGKYVEPLIDMNEPPMNEGKGFSTKQLAELVQIFKSLQGERSDPSSERINLNRLMEMAPRFDLKNPVASWNSFKVFFDLNQVVSSQTKFNILNYRIPWETMQQYGRENPNGGGDINQLEIFLKAYGKRTAPSMNYCSSVQKYGSGSILREVLHEAKSMADLDRGERIKLNSYLLTSGSNREIVQSYMHLPIEQFLSKLSQKWNESAPSSSTRELIVRRSPPRPYREYKSKTFANPQSVPMCYYHRKYGNEAFKCEGNECRMRGALRSRKEPARPVEDGVGQYAGNDPSQTK